MGLSNGWDIHFAIESYLITTLKLTRYGNYSLQIGVNMKLGYFILRSGELLLLSTLVSNISCIRAQMEATATISDKISETQPPSRDRNKPTAIQESIDVNGTTRTFLLYIPRSYRSGESALIIALHGRGGG